MSKRIMAIGAHADDIELYVGGTLAKYRDLGYEVVYVLATNNMSGLGRAPVPGGGMHYYYESPPAMMKRRKSEAEVAAKVFEAVPIHLDHPQRHYSLSTRPYIKGEEICDDGCIQLRYGCVLPEEVPANIPTILTAYEHRPSVTKLADLILSHNPEVIFTHGFVQVDNVEHYATCALVIRAYEEAKMKGYEGHLLLWQDDCEKLGKFNACWETWIEVSEYLDRKMETLHLHACQFPAEDPRAENTLRARALKWGKASGGIAAEVFNFVTIPDEESAKEGVLKELHDHRR